MRNFRFILIFLFFIIPAILFSQMESIVINNPVFKSKSRMPVKFNHVKHMSLDAVSCSDCHHRFVNGRNVLDPAELTDANISIRCSYCHTDETGLKNAYHRLCVMCHNSMVKKSKPTGPRLCGECHK